MLKSRFVTVYIIAFFSIFQAGVILPPDNLENWEILMDDKIWIGWERSDEFDWCRAKATLDASISDIRQIIENKKNYPNIFKRIDITKIITDEIVYIALDMPFPFYGRDYVVKYIQEQNDSDFTYQFHAVVNPKAPTVDDYIRLVNAAGEWELKSLNSTQTEVSYTWNGELLGDFPNWALKRAWKQQGLEVITWLKEAIE